MIDPRLTRLLDNLPSQDQMKAHWEGQYYNARRNMSGPSRFTMGSGDLRSASSRRQGLIQDQVLRAPRSPSSLFKAMNLPTAKRPTGYIWNFGEVAREGAKFAVGETARAAWGGTKIGVRAARSVAPTAYKAANAASKFFTGASAPQLALAAGVATAGFFMVEQALLRKPTEDIQKAGNVLRQAGQALSKKSYATTSYQQSTQGLMFGLHNKRTR